MCGIAGFYGCPELKEAKILESMMAAIAHRGPDAANCYLDPNGVVALLHTRLAVIDLENGNQPMASGDGRYVLVFNGEIYNFQALREELRALGHQFRTNSDTEVVLNSYRQWGSECVTRLRGMFAFAIFETAAQTLFLARDRTGMKPLYYYFRDGRFIFGSELKAILTAPIVPRKIHFPALADYLMLGYPLAPATMFADCLELPPGHSLSLSKTGLTTRQYWKWSYDNGKSGLKQQDVLAWIESELIATLREHLIADVPVGAFLSGGIDSSLLVSLIAKGLNRSIRTFTVRFDEQEYDESPYARAVADFAKTDHCEIRVESGSCDFDLLGRIVDQFDQPFADSSAIPTYLLCREVRRHVKVAISGDGGDEMFGGYPRFQYARIAHALGRAPQWSLLCAERCNEALRAVAPEAVRKGRRLIRSARRRNSERLLCLSCYHYPEDLEMTLRPEVAAAIGAYRPNLSEDLQASPGAPEFVEATVAKELPGDYLRKVDVMSCAHGLEVRLPFLGDRILASAAHIPASKNFSWSGNKLLLRQLARKYLPAAVAKKPKWGFGVPFDSLLGLKGRQMMRAELNGSTRLSTLLNRAHMECLLDAFVQNHWERHELSRWSLYQRVYMFWSLHRWLEKWQPTS
jgi:asparagine synthase (glutamine-hydrolysing)